MFEFLAKFLPLFIYPIGIVSLTLMLAIMFRKHQRFQNGLLFFALMVLWLGGNRWVAWSLARSLEWRHLPPRDIPKADVIVVLGGATDAAQYPRSTVEVNSAGDRIIYAAWLYQKGVADHILLSGGSIPWLDPDPSSPAEEMASLLSMLGIPERALWLEEQSHNTYENAYYCRQILEDKGIQRIILVTSAMHMPRAVKLFEHQGFEVIPAATDFTVTEVGWQYLWHADWTTHLLNFFPSVGNLSLTTKVMKEYIGMLVYHLRGWL